MPSTFFFTNCFSLGENSYPLHWESLHLIEMNPPVLHAHAWMLPSVWNELDQTLRSTGSFLHDSNSYSGNFYHDYLQPFNTTAIIMHMGIIHQETLQSELAGNELAQARRNHPTMHDAHLSQHCFLASFLYHSSSDSTGSASSSRSHKGHEYALWTVWRRLFPTFWAFLKQS